MKNNQFYTPRINISALMKYMIQVSLFLFCTNVFCFTTTESFAQNEQIQIIEDMTVSVDEVFELIRNQTDYSFIYQEDTFKNFPLVPLKKGVFGVNELLNQAVQGKNVKVDFSGNTIIINKIDAVLQVSGIVVDQDGSPLTGVSVVEEGTFNGTATDIDGKFTISVELGKTLVFSYIGFETQKIVVGESQLINVTLQEDIQGLDEVVITGYQKLSVNKSTGSTATVNSTTLERKGNPGLIASLEGQVAGLSLVPDPTREGGLKFDIRGITTINGNSQPLIVVDGFPIEGDIESINPYEVETVSVLKDAAATSIYGTRAANGVIVISTKRGRENTRPSINYRNFFTVGTAPDLGYRLNRVSSKDLVDLQLEAYSKLSRPPQTYSWWLQNNPNYAGYFAYATNNVYDAVAKVREGTMTQDEANALYEKLRNTDNLSQLQDNFYQSSFQQQHNFSVRGGGASNTYRASLNYTGGNSRFAGDKSDRIILDVLNNFKLNKAINVDVSANVYSSKNKSIPINLANIYNISSYENLVDEAGNYLPVRLRNITRGTNNGGEFGGKDPVLIQSQVDAGLLDESFYPLKELESYTENYNELALRLQTRLNAQFTKNLIGSVSLQYETGASKNDKLSKLESFEVTQLINNTTPLNYNGDETALNIPIGDRLIQTRGNKNSYTLRGQLDFSKRFNDLHEVTLLGGSEIRHVFTSGTRADKFGYDPSSLLFKNVDRKTLQGNLTQIYHPSGGVAGGIPFKDRFEERTNRFFSLFGNGIYGYDDRYILSGSIRVDQSNLFGTDPKYRYKPFWSVGAKWRVAEEAFFNSSVIDRLDFRASYGVNGNVSNDYGPFDIAEALLPYRSGFVNSLTITNPAIPDLRWETTKTTNFGVDIALLNNKISLGVDYYIKKTKDLIANGKADPTLGFSNLVFNDASIDNRGVEISLNTINVRNDNFTWSTLFTFRHNKNEVTKSFSRESDAYYLAGYNNLAGAPMASYWLFNYKGVNENGDPVLLKANGDELVLDASFDPIGDFDINDVIYAGTTQPVYFGALTNSFGYKNFSLSSMFVGSGGHVLRKDSYNGEFIGNTPVSVNKDAGKAWKKAGDEANTDIPRVNLESPYAAGVINRSTKNIVDGDFIRLRELILTYNIPISKYTSKIQSLGVHIRGNNLYYWSKNKENIDAESHGLGTRYFSIRPSYSFGVNVNF